MNNSVKKLKVYQKKITQTLSLIPNNLYTICLLLLYFSTQLPTEFNTTVTQTDQDHSPPVTHPAGLETPLHKIIIFTYKKLSRCCTSYIKVVLA